MTDISFGFLLKLMGVVDVGVNRDLLIPDLPESPYLYKAQKKIQRIRHPKPQKAENY